MGVDDRFKVADSYAEAILCAFDVSMEFDERMQEYTSRNWARVAGCFPVTNKIGHYENSSVFYRFLLSADGENQIGNAAITMVAKDERVLERDVQALLIELAGEGFEEFDEYPVNPDPLFLHEYGDIKRVPRRYENE